MFHPAFKGESSFWTGMSDYFYFNILLTISLLPTEIILQFVHIHLK